MMRELTLANAMQNIRVTEVFVHGDVSFRHFYNQIILGECELPHAKAPPRNNFYTRLTLVAEKWPHEGPLF